MRLFMALKLIFVTCVVVYFRRRTLKVRLLLIGYMSTAQSEVEIWDRKNPFASHNIKERHWKLTRQRVIKLGQWKVFSSGHDSDLIRALMTMDEHLAGTRSWLATSLSYLPTSLNQTSFFMNTWHFWWKLQQAQNMNKVVVRDRAKAVLLKSSHAPYKCRACKVTWACSKLRWTRFDQIVRERKRS